MNILHFKEKADEVPVAQSSFEGTIDKMIVKGGGVEIRIIVEVISSETLSLLHEQQVIGVVNIKTELV